MADGSWGNDPIQSMGMDESDAHALFDKTFGKGKWRISGGFRTPQRERELRSEGAETVAPGGKSAHSEGLPDAPGAYDIVVDGLTPDQAAAKLKGSGAKFTKLLPESTHGTQGSHLHVQPQMAFQDDWGNDPVQKVAPPTQSHPASQPGALPTKPNPDDWDRAPLSSNPATAAVAGEGQAIDRLKRDAQTWWKGAQAAAKPGGQVTGKASLSPEAQRESDVANRLFSLAPGSDLAELIQHPVGEAAASVLQRPANALATVLHGATKTPAESGRTLASGLGLTAAMAAGGRAAGEEAAAADGANALKAAVKPRPELDAHGQDVRALHDAGIRMTPGQIQGGVHRAMEEKRVSDPNQGYAIKERVDQSIDDFNRAMYGKSLKLIGEKYPKDGPVGERAIDDLFSKGEAKYEQLKPDLHARMDAPLETGIAEAREQAGIPGSRERGEFDALVKSRITDPLARKGVLTGQDFKDLESFLTKNVKAYQNSPDAYQRKLGAALEDVQTELRGSLERHSDPKVRGQLKDLNSYWASVNRLSDAAYAAKAQGGRFSPNQVLAAAGKGGRYQRRMVARGKAFDQDLISAAQRVLPDKIPNSGTTDRALANRGVGRNVGTVIGAGMGGALGSHAGIEGIGAGGGLGGLIGGQLGGAVDRAIAPAANELARQRLNQLAVKQLQRKGIGSSNALAARLRPPSGGAPPVPPAALMAPTSGQQSAQQ